MYQDTPFIGRKDWLVKFADYRQQQDGIVWQITGQGGIGKTTLLHEFKQECMQVEHAHCFLDLENFALNQGFEVLQAIIQSASHFGRKKCGNWLSQAESKLDILKERYSEELKLAHDGLQVLDGLFAGGEAVEGAQSAVAYAKNRINKKDTTPFIHHKLEQQLLEHLALAGKYRAVLLVDTFEHLLHQNLQLKSRLDFNFQPPQEQSGLKQTAVAAWLMSLFHYLQAQGWCIVIAGRVIDNKKTAELQPFNPTEITTAIQSRPILKPYMNDHSEEMLSILTVLSFNGNPLWLHLAMNKLERLLEQGKHPQQLAQNPQQLHAYFERSDPFDLSIGIEQANHKLSLLESHFQSLEGVLDSAWKLALPRFLSTELAEQLVPVEQLNNILKKFTQAGMFRQTGELFRLHDEARDLLLAYARNKGWEKSVETRELHGQLWEFINQKYLDGLGVHINKFMENIRNSSSDSRSITLGQEYPEKWVLEACYHRCLSRTNLLESSILPEEFNQSLLASVSLNPFDKWRVANALLELSEIKLLGLLKVFSDEVGKWEKIFGKQVAERLLIDMEKAKVISVNDIAYWQQQVKDYGLAGDYFALTLALSESKQDPEHLIQVVNKMLEYYSENEQAGIQVQCAKVLCKKGWIQENILNQPEQAIETYDQLLQQYSDHEQAEIQEQCVKVLYSKGWIQENILNQPEQAIETYDQLLQQYSEHEQAEIQALCAKALINKGVTQGNKLHQPEQAIETYDQLLQQYGEHEQAEIQVLCAQALFNKGVTQENKLNQPEQAIETFKQLLQQYSEHEQAEIQVLCAKALYSKGWTQGNKLNQPEQAIETYKQLLQQFGDSEHEEVQSQCLSARSNLPEMLLLQNRNQEAIETIQQVLEQVDNDSKYIAIMSFLYWLADDTREVKTVLDAIESLAKDIEYGWNWGDIRPYISQLKRLRQVQANSFIAYFEQHRSIETLKADLAC